MSDQDPTTPAPVLQDSNRKPGTFLPGDKRINRRGRPKSFPQLRERVLAFLSEQDDEASNTRLETILRQLAINDPKTLLEYGFGKVPAALDLRAHVTNEQVKLYAIVSPDDWNKPALPVASSDDIGAEKKQQDTH